MSLPDASAVNTQPVTLAVHVNLMLGNIHRLLVSAECLLLCGIELKTSTENSPVRNTGLAYIIAEEYGIFTQV